MKRSGAMCFAAFWPCCSGRRALEQRLQEKGQSWEWGEILRGLDNLQEVDTQFGGKRFVLRSQLQGQVHLALMAAGVAVPPTLREVA